MKIDRRDLLKLGMANLLMLAMPKVASGSAPELAPVLMQKGPSILQGATDETKTQFSIMVDSQIRCDVFVTDKSGKIWKVDKTDTITHAGQPKKVLRVYFSDLDENGIYLLNVVNLETNELLDKREFKMLKRNRTSFRFAICSCMHDKNHEAAIWKDIVAKKPDVIFFVGDIVYADTGIKGAANPTHLWKRFSEARQTLDIYFSYRLIPILATWDDHDFGLNNSNSETYPYVKESQKNFLSFFAQEESHCRLLKRGPGVSSAFQWNTQLFLLLDDRSYRKPKNSENRYAHWGREQEEWMLGLIAKNNGPSWIMNGSQFFPKALFQESLSSQHPVQFKGFLSELKKLSSKVIFVSGDVHYSEVSRIEKKALGYETYEITSSSIHSIGMPGAPDIMPNPRRITGTGARNYIMVDAQAVGTGVKMLVTSYSSEGRDLFGLALSVG